MSVSSHIASPLSKGLFTKAISESGTIFSLPYVLANGNGSLDVALNVSQEYTAELGCNGIDPIACMRNKTPEELLNATRSEVLFAPVFDGWFFPEDPYLIFSEGKQNEVPLLIGFNADEGSLFTNSSEASIAYREGAFIVPELRVADSMDSPVYFYEFTHAPPTPYGKRFGAYHSSEIPYVFGTIDAKDGYGTIDFTLSEKIMEYWTNFAKTGNPNGVGLPVWPVYGNSTQQYLELGDNVTVHSGLS
jgi:para-nitrobenzyl esterase